uniref:(northern house mosquito) hypothetical protein n=1 Tax=Culex pipiens TaxID=7175 RepID=A0A8D8KBJ0_CULPI
MRREKLSQVRPAAGARPEAARAVLLRHLHRALEDLLVGTALLQPPGVGAAPAGGRPGQRRPSGPSAVRVLRQALPGQGRTVPASAEGALFLPLLRRRRG